MSTTDIALDQAPRLKVPLALKHGLVACMGFAIDYGVLAALTHAGMQPAWARVISLTCAMQLTFAINGAMVFRCLCRKNFVEAWLGYMVTSGLGNACNYWLFVSLTSLHQPILSNRLFDLVMGGMVAWTINFTCARYLIFGADPGRASEGCTPIGEVARKIAARLAGNSPQSAAGTVRPVER